MDSPGSTEAEDAEDEPLPGPSRNTWDFFKPFAGAKPSKVLRSDEEVEGEDEDGDKGEEEEDENGWIVEDDGPEGVPELPVAFNMSSHQDLSHHFKIICQLFVHLAVRSPSRRVSFMRDVKAGKHTIQTPFHMISGVRSNRIRGFSRRQLLLCCPVNSATKDDGDEGFIDHLIDLANEFQEGPGEISRDQHGAYGFRGSRL